MNQTEQTTFDHAGNVIEHSITTTPAPASSVELSTDSKGNVKPCVKVYHTDPDQAAAEAVRIYQEIMEVLQVSVGEKVM